MHGKTLITWGVILGLGLAGCALHPRTGVSWPEPRPLGNDLPAFHPPARPEGPSREPLALEESTGAITLRQALSLALMRSPELADTAWEVRAREAAALQAELLPNPAISAEVEDIGGSGGFHGARQSQSTLQLGQLIELGGKRAARTRAASLTRDLAGWDYETKRLEVLTRVSQDFIDLVSAQQQRALAEEAVHLAGQVAGTVSARVEAGKVSPVEETRANVALSVGRIGLERARRALELSRRRLAATWGGTTPLFERAEGELGPVSALPPLEQLAQRLAQNPELARWAAELSQRQAAIEVERSKAIPDITVNGGYRWLNETSDQAFVVTLSLPLPLFNRNQGAILEARHRRAKAEEGRRAAEVRVTTALAEAYRRLSTAHAEVTALQTHVLPGAQSSFEAAREGYRLGKFGYLDVLDAQRTLFDARVQHLRALTDYHQAVAEVERLIGERLPLRGIGK